MEKVEFFDWNLSNLHPVSFLWSNYPKRLRPLRPRPDMHSALHLAWVQQGSRRGSFAHQQLDFSQSDFYLTAPWEPHCTLSTSEDHRLLLLNIDLESLQNHIAVFQRIVVIRKNRRMIGQNIRNRLRLGSINIHHRRHIQTVKKRFQAGRMIFRHPAASDQNKFVLHKKNSFSGCLWSNI